MSITSMAFPEANALSHGIWRPVFFSHNLDTQERFVIAAIASVGGKTEVIKANSLDRLKCLFGDEAKVALEAIEFGLESVKSTIFRSGLSDLSSSVSGVQIGPEAVGEAADARELAYRVLRMMSSFHSERKEYISQGVAVKISQQDWVAKHIMRDRLSVLVMEQMAMISPKSRAMFDSHVHRLERDEGARLLTHKAYVAFTGQNVAANFATLKPGRQKSAVDASKRLMWDLEQHREKEYSLMPRLSHEMILFHLDKSDPTITSRQYENIMDVVSTLKEEGQRREIDVLPYISVNEISKHMLEAENLA